MIALYARVSTQEQAAEGYSIDEQAERLKAFCRSVGRADYKLYIDAGWSGANTDRPELQHLLRDVQDGRIDRVVVYKLDRLSRSQKDTLELIEDGFLGNGVSFTSITEQFDTSSPFGRAMIGILAVFAQLEREQIRERVTMGREARAKSGLFHGGGNLPVGYDYTGGQLVVNPYEAMQIREAFELYNAGKAIPKIEKLFDEKGYTHKHGKWTTQRITAVLTNPLYTGRITYGGKVHEGQHERIVTDEVFEMAVTRHRDKSKPKPVEHRVGLLTGLIFCRRCGARYATSGSTYGGSVYRYYACYSRTKRVRSMIRDMNCKNTTYRKDKLEELVIEQIRKIALDPAEIARIRAESGADREDTKAELIAAEIAKINARRARYAELYGSGLYSHEELHDMIFPLTEQVEKLQQELEGIRSEEQKRQEKRAKEVLKTVGDVLDRGDCSEVRAVIEALIRRIEIDGEDIFIFWRF